MLSIPYLSCKTWYSLLDGALSPERLCSWARTAGLGAIAVCDKGNFYGLVKFIAAARAEGLKPICAMAFGKTQAYVLNAEAYSLLNIIAGYFLDHAATDAESAFLSYLENLLLARDANALGGIQGLALVLSPRMSGHGLVSTLQRMGFRKPYIGVRWGEAQELARKAAKSSGLPLLALAGGSWIDAEDAYRLALLAAVSARKAAPSQLEALELYANERVPEPREVEAFFSAIPEAVYAACELAEAATDSVLPASFVFPAFGGLSEAAAYQQLARLCISAIPRRFAGREEAARVRLQHELSIIREKGFTSYFLVVHDIVSVSPRTCGRGSAASSIVSYLLGITHVDPLRYNLYFERFLHRGRKDPPDIDIDFPWDEREKTLTYVFSKYMGSSGMVADHVTFASRSALREGALALGEGLETLAVWQRAWELGRYGDIPDRMWHAFKLLKGVPRNLGSHPGGVVISPRPLHHYVHTQTSPASWPLIAWEKDATEEAGLVKIDLLGNRSLAVLRDVLSSCVGSDKVMDHWNDMAVIDDKAAQKNMEAGDTLGVFYIESPATRQLLCKMGSVDFLHLVAASSIIRPAANRYAKDFVARLRGAAWQPVHERAGAVLAETYGIMVYQEDVSRVAMACAGFGPEDADALRKVFGKRNRGNSLELFRQKFTAGASTLGLRSSQIAELWDQMLSFDGYSFCKSHSASYALVSWQLAAIRAQYPLDFYLAVINNGGGFYTKQVYVNQVRRLGFSIDIPNVMLSEAAWTKQGKRALVGLQQIKALSDSLIERIIRERVRRSFRDLPDFLGRCRPDIGELSQLVRSGALDCFATETGRPGLFWRSLSRKAPQAGQGELLETDSPLPVKDYSRMRKLRDEVETLDLWCSTHALAVLRPRVYALLEEGDREFFCDSRDMKNRLGKRIIIAGSLVSSKEVLTKRVETMSFLSFDDEYGLFESVAFPQTYRAILPVLLGNSDFILYGKLSAEWGVISLELDKILPLNRRYLA